MILQALVRLYEDLLKKGEVPEYGWSPEKVTQAIYLDDDGSITDIVAQVVEEQRGKKTVSVPRVMYVPMHTTRSSGIKPNFLCDNTSYMLGIDAKDKPERAVQCFNAAKELHLALLADCDEPAAIAVKRFFEKWQPEQAAQCPVLQEKMADLLAASNLVFRYKGNFVHEVPAIRGLWQAACGSDENPDKAACLVTGKIGPVAKVHPMIKGIMGAQTSGAALVSFNGESFCSYGRTGQQGLNAPTGEYAAYAYATALNHLVSDKAHTNYIGDTICLCWASGAETAYQSAFGAFTFGMDSHYEQHDLQEMLKALVSGQSIRYDEAMLDPACDFYVLGISPNAARLSIRFFEHNSFGKLLQNVAAHQQRLEIERPAFDTFETLPVWKILRETVNQNARTPKPQDIMAGDLLRAILNNTRYPASLLNALTLRIRAEHVVNRAKAAMIKAYYLQNTNKDVPKEVLTVALNEQSKSIPYNLGRLFAVLEAVQESANPGINSTIKDKYFNSASAIA